MFIVFNKEKIYSYLVALSTVVVLFSFAFIATNNSQKTVQTSTNMQENVEEKDSTEQLNAYLNN